MPAKASIPTPPVTAHPVQPPVAGTRPGSVTAALQAPSLELLAGRAVLAFAGTPNWNGNPVGWRFRAGLVAVWAGLRARWLALRCFGLGLALAPWQGNPNKTATLIVDGLWLKFTKGLLWLQVACPAGHDPHEVPLPSLPVLGELLVAAQLTPDLPPWACPPGCPGADPAALAAAGHPRLRPASQSTSSPDPSWDTARRPADMGGDLEEPPSC